MLRAVDLAIGYPGQRVGEGFSLTLIPGQVMALLGPNGGGKSTLLKTLLGLLPAQAGLIELEDRPLASFSPRERARRLAYVPQHQSEGFGFSVRETVLMARSAQSRAFAGPSAADREAAEAAIARLGLEALAERPLRALSGGERQLALIARALAQQSRLIVLDEPTATLDFGNQGKVMREIRRMAAEGLGILFTTHDPNQARRFADTALLIRDGRTLAQGPVETVISRESLTTLYGAPVLERRDPDSGASAFLPA